MAAKEQGRMTGLLSLISGNLLSKGVGIIREGLFAGWFGTGNVAAAFRIGQTGFLLPTHSLIGDALSAGLLPLYKQYQNEDVNKARTLVIIAAIYGLIFSAFATSLLFFFADNVVRFIAPGASEPALDLAGSLLQIMALATPFYVLSGMLSYIEAGHGHYGAIAWRPMLLNFGSIGGAALAVWLGQAYWLAIGLLLSHAAFFIWTSLQLSKLDRLTPENFVDWPLVRSISLRFLANMLPLLGLPLIAQGNFLVERIVSSWVGTAIIPSVDYARFIADTTVQLIAVPLGIITMAMHGGSSPVNMREHLVRTTSTILILSVPIATFIAQNAEAIVRIVFARGAFGEDAVQTTTSILQWMGGALGATVVAYYLVKALNAQLRNREALLFTAISCAVNMLVNLLCWPFLGAQVIGIGVAAASAVLSTLTIAALGLWNEVAKISGWLVAGLAAQVLLTAIATTYLPHPIGLFASMCCTTIVWLGLSLFVPSMKSALKPALDRLPFVNRLIR